MLPFITANALRRVLQLAVPQADGNFQTGTGFFIEISGSEYLISAKHLFANAVQGQPIQFNHDQKWKPTAYRVVGHADGDVDITVVKLPHRVIQPGDLELPASVKGLAISQETYFLGFPFGLGSEVGQMNNGYPLPFVKRATVSAFTHKDSMLHQFYLDGVNNTGFSGGPVVFYDQGDFKVAGVVIGYRINPSFLYKGDQRQETFIRENTGIISAYGIDHAIRIIESHPSQQQG